ncbi:MAG: hypothetical protein WEE64_13810 [Dehalococcoidia bacterium]
MSEQPGQLPVPPEFAFDWDSPDEALRLWAADLMHWPNGISQLAATMDMPAFGRGMTKAAQELCMPFERVHFKYIRGYVYTSFDPSPRTRPGCSSGSNRCRAR